MKKIVINDCYGGFSLSETAIQMYVERNPNMPDCNIDYLVFDIERDDPCLIQIIEEIGLDKAGGRYAELKIIEIPDDVEWIIQNYDGVEWVAEKHRTWG